MASPAMRQPATTAHPPTLQLCCRLLTAYQPLRHHTQLVGPSYQPCSVHTYVVMCSSSEADRYRPLPSPSLYVTTTAAERLAWRYTLWVSMWTVPPESCSSCCCSAAAAVAGAGGGGAVAQPPRRHLRPRGLLHPTASHASGPSPRCATYIRPCDPPACGTPAARLRPAGTVGLWPGALPISRPHHATAGRSGTGHAPAPAAGVATCSANQQTPPQTATAASSAAAPAAAAAQPGWQGGWQGRVRRQGWWKGWW